MAVTVLIVVVATILALVVAVNLRLRAALPTHAARRKLSAQIGEAERLLDAASVKDEQLVARQIQEVRRRWMDEHISATPIEALDIPGTGPSTYQALRDHGIATLEDLGRLRNYKITGIGEKKESQLLAGQSRATQDIVARADRMNVAELDAYTQGRLGTVIKNHEADERERYRRMDELRIQLATLRRRRALVSV